MRINPSVRSLFFILVMLAIPAASSAQIILSIGFAPPPLPVYEQPVCPDAGYLWTPGYWAYAQEGYFWVPGTWVMGPEPGLLWPPRIRAGAPTCLLFTRVTGVLKSASTAA